MPTLWNEQRSFVAVAAVESNGVDSVAAATCMVLLQLISHGLCRQEINTVTPVFAPANDTVLIVREQFE